MIRISRAVVLSGLLTCLLWNGPSKAASVITQSPCVTSAGFCKAFNSKDPIPIIRSIVFNLPSAADVVVTFHGSLYCVNDTGAGGQVIDLVSQITTGGGSADVNGPGGLRHAAVLAGTTSDSFNLTSTRVISYPSGGSKTIHFKIARLRMDYETACYVYNAAFTVLITP
jgi:hypothetical protein